MEKLKIGTRKSLLALAQTKLVADKLKEAFPEIEIELVTMTTRGDEWLNKSLSSFGGKGVFTKELEEGLYEGTIDIAVHSAKDMPSELPDGLMIGAVLERADVRDVIVTRDGTHLEAMAPGTVVGTGSLRRQLQIEAINPQLEVRQIRGNVQTRLTKLKNGEYDGIVLAAAGLERLNYKDAKDFDYGSFHYEYISEDRLLPAAAQGILAVECREGDTCVAALLRAICDDTTWAIFEAERSFLTAVGGGCNAPAAALAKTEGGRMVMTAVYADENSKRLVRAQSECALPEISDDDKALCRQTNEGGSVRYAAARALGQAVAKKVLAAAKGARGFVSLIGAGPGDKGLITVRGLEALRSADVVVYDNLASNALLQEVRRDAELIYAGKRAGQHYMKQDETNALLVAKAKEGRRVARLKGGDPFIFGRGGEEALALRAADIDFEVIPGVSSSYAVAAYNGIPVTHRGLASSFHVITGHEDASKTESVLDYETLAKEEGTLIFLMGLKNLPKITERLMAFGKDKKTPAAVMQEGTTARQKMAVGTLENIVAKAQEAGIKTPAITIIGDVVSLYDKLSWFGKQPLSGKSVLITASDMMTKALSQKVRALGGEALDFGLIYTEPMRVNNLEKYFHEDKPFTWVVFTSRNGVDIFFEEMRRAKLDVRAMAGMHFAVIGKGTKEALEAKGIFCDCLPTLYSSEDLGKALIPKLEPEDKVLLLRAEEASAVLTDMLAVSGVEFEAVPVYKTAYDWRKAEELNRIVAYADYITFCSASAVKAFDAMIDKENKFKGKIVCIGPVTARAARALGYEVYKEARQYDIDGLTDCLLEDVCNV